MREKKQFYSEHVRFEMSVRHPSRGHQAENYYMVLEAGAQERATDISSVIVGIQIIFKAKDWMAS